MEDEKGESNSSQFGSLLRRHRLAAGHSQESLAERAGMSTHGISALERGYRRSPQRETVTLLANALGLAGESRLEFEAAALQRTRDRARGSVARGPWPADAESNLPISVNSFRGREVELQEIGILIWEHRLVTVTGPGGIGKTQTASRVAATVGTRIDGATRFVGLAPIGESKLLAGALASALGIEEVRDRPLLETIAAYLKNRTLLLILDNCEHVIAEAASIACVLLSSCPHVRILATSREPLKTAGEHMYRLSSLDSSAAMALFSDRARAVNHSFELSSEAKPVVAQICRRLDGIPLAIELAAARMSTLSLKALSERLDRGLRILTGGERTALPRQQTMRAAIEWSYNLLLPEEQRVFERLSVFAGSCTLDSASAVCTDETIAENKVLDTLSSLVDKSLLVFDSSWTEPRFVLLEPIRDFGLEKLGARGATWAAQHRHAIASLSAAEHFDSAVLYEAEDLSNEIADAEGANWRAALQWTLAARGDPLCGLRLLGQLDSLWWGFDPVEGRRWLDIAFEFVDEHTPPDVEARLRLLWCGIAMTLYEYEEALRSSETALELSRAAGYWVGVMQALNTAALSLVSLGRAEEAKTLAEESLPLARALKLPSYAGHMLRCMGNAAIRDGDYTAARGFYESTLQLFEEAGRKTLAALVRAERLSIVAFLSGNNELALKHAMTGISQLRRLSEEPHAKRNQMPLAGALGFAAMYLVALSRHDEAKEVAIESLRIARNVHAGVTIYALQHVAVAATSSERGRFNRSDVARSKAARILGYVNARLPVIGNVRGPAEQWEYDEFVAELRKEIAADELAKYFALGAEMLEDEAVDLALTL